MMSINLTRYIINQSGATKYYVGVPIADGASLVIPVEKYTAYSTNDGLLADIGSGDVVISTDGINSVGTVSDQINTLKGFTGPSDSDGAPLSRARAFANADNMRFRGQGVSGTAIKSTTTNIDHAVTETRFINGLEFIVQNQAFGDKAHFQVVDVDNILGYGANTVLDQFGTDWHIASDCERQGPYILPYPAQVVGGLYLRIVYQSVGTVSDVDLKINYFLHMKSA